MISRLIGALLLVASIFTNQKLMALDAVDVARRAASSINSIKSYDVAVDFQYLTFEKAMDATSDTNPSTITTSERDRDVFLFGVGRRFERNTEQFDHAVAVKEWNAGNALSARRMNYAITGMNYFDYYNPVLGDWFLSELLADEKTKFGRLNPIDAVGGKAFGISLSHPDLNGPVHLWLSPQHGDMPVQIDVRISSGKNTSVLFTRTMISQFIEMANGAWAPVAGKCTQHHPTGPTAGREVLGFEMVVAPSSSSWNSVSDNNLFATSSLLEHNWTSDSGWNEYYPADTLAAMQDQKKIWEKAQEQIRGGLTGGPRRNLWIVVNVAIVVLIVLLWAWRRHRSGALYSAK